jgi:hypothetical protein
MMSKDPKEMTKEELKEEHRQMQGELENKREERRQYEDTETTGGRQTQQGSREETERIDQEMDGIRKRQKELYDEHQNRG